MPFFPTELNRAHSTRDYELIYQSLGAMDQDEILSFLESENINICNLDKENTKKTAETFLRNQLGFTPGMNPASTHQQAMWFLSKLSEDSSAYIVKLFMKTKTFINPTHLHGALLELVKACPALRTTFANFNGEFIQTVQITHEESILFFESKAIDDLDRTALEDMQGQIDLEHGPLLHVFHYALPGGDSAILIKVHHIASDIISLEKMNKLLWAHYQRLSSGTPLEPAQEDTAFIDFAHRESAYLRSREGAQDREYWSSQLSGELPVLEILPDHPRNAHSHLQGAIHPVSLGAESTERIRSFCRHHQTTPYRFLLAVYSTLLFRYTGQTDLIIGSPSATRRGMEPADAVGYFVNMLPFRIQIGSGSSFVDHLGSVDRSVKEGLQHARYPFPRMVSDAHAARDLSTSSIFQTSLSMGRSADPALAGVTKLALGGSDYRIQFDQIELESIPFYKCGSQFDLSIYAEEIQDTLHLWFMYKSALYEPATIEQFARHFTNLLEGVLASPESPLHTFDFLLAEERRKILQVWNRTDFKAPGGTSLVEVFERQAKALPEATALTCDGTHSSYDTLNRAANCVARRLRRNGLRPGDLVPICLDPSFEMIAGILGILKAGAAYIPLNPVYPKDRVRAILDDVQPRLVITDDKYEDKFDLPSLQLVPPETTSEARNSPEGLNLDLAIRPEDTAYIIYTSGSTGVPKGVMVSHHNVVRLFTATDHWFGFNQDDVWSLFHSVSFDFSVWEIFGALLYGGRLLVVPYLTSRSPEAFYRLLETEGVTVLSQTPSAFQQLSKIDECRFVPDRLKLRYIVFGGEALELKTLEPWFQRHGDQSPALINMYGITETTVHVTYRPITAEDCRSAKGSVIGIPIPDLQVYLLDEHQRLVPTGCCGEIYVGGDGLAKGYLNQPILTRERFMECRLDGQTTQRLYRSGDLARFHQNGDLEYLGRKDQQVKIRGFRIELGDIESQLIQHPEIQRAVVLLQKREDGSNFLNAYLVTRSGAAIDPLALKQFLKERIPDYMVPSNLYFVSSIPITINGKVDRKALIAQPPIPYIDLDGDTLAGDLEGTIVAVWKSVLKLESIPLHGSFFDLGGDSILLVKVHHLLKESLAPFLQMHDLFQHPSVQALAAFIEARSRTGSHPGHGPLLPSEGNRIQISCAQDSTPNRSSRRQQRRGQDDLGQ